MGAFGAAPWFELLLFFVVWMNKDMLHSSFFFKWISVETQRMVWLSRFSPCGTVVQREGLVTSC